MATRADLSTAVAVLAGWSVQPFELAAGTRIENGTFTAHGITLADEFRSLVESIAYD